MPVPLNYMILGAGYREAMQIMFDKGYQAAADARRDAMGLPPEMAAKVKVQVAKMRRDGELIL